MRKMLECFRWPLLGLGLCLGLVAARPAEALSLDTVIGGGSFAAGDLVLEDFEASVGGDLIPSLSFYDVDFLSGGLVLTGPLSAADGEVGLFVLGFTVRAPAGGSLTGAMLQGPVAASGVGAQASVDAALDELASGDLVASLGLFDTGAVAGDAVTVATAPLGGAPEALRVQLTVVLDSLLVGGALGGSARAPSITARFASLPEPGTLALLAVGLLGLARAGRPRRPLNAVAVRCGGSAAG